MFTRAFVLAIAAYLPFALAAPTAGPIGAQVINAGAENTVPHRYIVRLKDNISESAIAAHKANIESVHAANAIKRRNEGSTQTFRGIKHNYNFANIKGYSGEFDDETLEALKRSPEVAYIEAVHIYTTQDIEASRTRPIKAQATQANPPWGLARIAQRNKLPTNSASWKYPYNDKAGSGTTVYVIDTGIEVGHTEFEGRAKWGLDATSEKNNRDGNGHGTHCAGTIAGKTYGVAKKASLVAVKVLRANGNGYNDDIIAGLQYVARDGANKAAVASMSLGGGFSQTLNSAVQAVINKGIPVAVAAGNWNENANDYSPASLPDAVTVGASDVNDVKATFSNWGSRVDIHAPGVNVKSAWIGGGVNTISGTSMATPHVAGVMAYLMSTGQLDTKAGARAAAKLVSMASANKLTGLRSGTPNYLLYHGGA